MTMTRVRPVPKLAAVVLAAGQSKRFRSQAPKVLHPLLGRPLIGHVLTTLRELHRSAKLSEAAIVVPPGGRVEEALKSFALPFPVTFVVQEKPLGTGHAARIGLDVLGSPDEVLVLAGDCPLLRPATLARLVRARRRAGAEAAALTAVLDDPAGYGRIVREGDRVTAVVEARDATAAQRRIKEINTSTYVFAAQALRDALPRLRRSNAQSEYYLTDAIGLASSVVAVEAAPEEALGANTRRDYALVTRVLRERVLDGLMRAGVTVADPGSTFVDVDVRVGADTVLLPMTILEGSTRIGRACEIGPNVRLVDTTVGDGAVVTFAVARQTRIGPRATVGPFASLRAGTVLRRGAKVGTFVETKAADVGEGAKVPHLAYMGDVTIGKRSNVGAGSITCNYDGRAKHRTVIGDDAFVGSNTMLRAPVRIGRGAYTGAGSVVTRDVAPGQKVAGVPARPIGDKGDQGGTGRDAKGDKSNDKSKKKGS